VILLKNASYVVRDGWRVERDTDVLVEGERIRSVGRTCADETAAMAIDCRGKAVIPGLVNAHTHLYQSMLKGGRDDLSLVDWCEQVTFPFVRSVLDRAWRADGSEEIGRLWSLLGSVELIRSGVTCVVDMDISFQSVLQAWLDIGIRGVAAMTMVDCWVPQEIMLSREASFESTSELIDRWHGVPRQSPRISVALGPAAPFTCSREMLAWIRDQSEQHELVVSTHVSETAWEVEQSIKAYGLPPLAYLGEHGLLDRPLMAVHGVHLTEAEIELAAGRPVVVVYNPKSNMKLGSGVAPIVALRAAGVELAVGTDGAASNDLLDMFEEMRVGAMLQKVTHSDPTVIGARDLFRMATQGGAEACQLDAGTIDEGKLADIAVVDLSGAHMFSLTDEIVASLVYCAQSADVDTVIVNGKPVLWNRKLVSVDEQLVLREARKAGEGYV